MSEILYGLILVGVAAGGFLSIQYDKNFISNHPYVVSAVAVAAGVVIVWNHVKEAAPGGSPFEFAPAVGLIAKLGLLVAVIWLLR